MKDAHDTRCERSATKVGRCRCDCGGNLHGVEHTRAAMLRALANEAITEDEYTDWLDRVRGMGAAR